MKEEKKKIQRKKIDDERGREKDEIIKCYNHNSITNRLYARWVIKYYRYMSEYRIE